MFLEYFRANEYKNLLSYLKNTDPVCKRWADVVHRLVKHTVFKHPDSHTYLCVSYFGDMYEPEQILEIFSKSEIDPSIYADMLAVASGNTGVEAQTRAVRLVCTKFQKDQEKRIRKGITSLDSVVNTTNIFNLSVVGFHKRIDFGNAKTPPKYAPIVHASISACALDRTPLDGECAICLVKDDVLSRSDHICDCLTQSMHFSCLRIAARLGNATKCPVCNTKMEIPVNKLAEEVFDVQVSGMNTESIADNVKKMERTMTYYPADPRDTINAYAQLIRDLEIKPQFEVPDIFDPVTFEMTFDGSSKNGFYANDELNPELRYTYNPTKSEAYQGNMMTWLADIAALRKVYQETGKLTDDQVLALATAHYYIIRFKQEQKQNTTTRSFFVPQGRKFMFDKLTLLPLFKRYYNKKYIMVGFQWQRAGARRLFDKLQGKFPGQKQTHFFMEWDISGMDQSVKAFQILMNKVIFLMEFLHHENEELDKVFRMIYSFLADNSAFHDVKWFGPYSWRRIIGILFSGEYDTSMSNTITSAILFLSWLFFNRRMILEKIETLGTSEQFIKEKLEKLIVDLEAYIKNILAQFFGDDGLAAIPLSLCQVLCLSTKFRQEKNINGLPPILPIFKSFEEYLKQQCDMSLKLSDSAEYRHMYTLVDDNDDIVQVGPKILKRHFKLVQDPRNGEYDVHAWRPCAMWKISAPLIEGMTHSHQIIRLLGHIQDTMGNNKRQYDMIRHSISYHISKLGGETAWADKLDKMLFNETLTANTSQAINEVYEKLLRLLGEKPSSVVVKTMLKTIPEREALQAVYNKPDLSFYEVNEPQSWRVYQGLGLA